MADLLNVKSSIEDFVAEQGFLPMDFNCWRRETKRKCPVGSKPVVIELEVRSVEDHDAANDNVWFICFVHIGKCSHRVVVNSRSDLLRVIEVFENKEV